MLHNKGKKVAYQKVISFIHHIIHPPLAVGTIIIINVKSFLRLLRAATAFAKREGLQRLLNAQNF
jgi:hypothetical protein